MALWVSLSQYTTNNKTDDIRQIHIRQKYATVLYDIQVGQLLSKLTRFQLFLKYNFQLERALLRLRWTSRNNKKKPRRFCIKHKKFWHRSLFSQSDAKGSFTYCDCGNKLDGPLPSSLILVLGSPWKLVKQKWNREVELVIKCQGELPGTSRFPLNIRGILPRIITI